MPEAYIQIPASALESIRSLRAYFNDLLNSADIVCGNLREGSHKVPEAVQKLYVYPEAYASKEAFIVFMKEKFNDAPYWFDVLTDTSLWDVFMLRDELPEEWMDRVKRARYELKFPTNNEIGQNAYSTMLKELAESEAIHVHSGFSKDSEIYDQVFGQTARELLNKMLRAANVRIRDY